MEAIPPFTDESAARLRSFLDAPGRSGGTMGFCELGGFLFAMGCSPRMVQPSLWLPEIFGGEEPEYETLEEARDVVQMVLALYNRINEGIGAGSPELPPGCSPDPRPVANLDPHSPLGAWSRGFLQGHNWLDELWADVVPEELDGELGAQLMVLTFFSGRALAEGFHREAGGDQSLESMAESMLKVLPEAMAAYAHLGRSIDQALREIEARHRPARRTKVGRNEPCPCGSGRKYKRCCGAH